VAVILYEVQQVVHCCCCSATACVLLLLLLLPCSSRFAVLEANVALKHASDCSASYCARGDKKQPMPTELLPGQSTLANRFCQGSATETASADGNVSV
jgi:hypothetical protein